jgi:hypothetical protein
MVVKKRADCTVVRSTSSGSKETWSGEEKLDPAEKKSGAAFSDRTHVLQSIVKHIDES